VFADVGVAEVIQPSVLGEAAVHCSCGYTREWQLPCRHVFAVHRQFPLRYSLTNIDHFGKRWHLSTRMPPAVGVREDGSATCLIMLPDLAKHHALVPEREDDRRATLARFAQRFLHAAGNAPPRSCDTSVTHR